MSVADIIYDTPWYQLSKAEGNAVYMIVQRAQKPFHLKGLNLLDCSLGTYLDVQQQQKHHFSFELAISDANGKCALIWIFLCIFS